MLTQKACFNSPVWFNVGVKETRGYGWVYDEQAERVKKLESGVPISGSVEAAGAVASDLRQDTNYLLAEYEHCRHEMRLAFIGPSLDEGMSIGEIGRTLGVSRQLAARLAKEAHGGPSPEMG